MESTEYVHGYTEREALRLNDQAATLVIHFSKDLESKNKTQPIQ